MFNYIMLSLYDHIPYLILDYDNSEINNAIHIVNPEMSQVFYGQLNKHGAYYTISSPNTFRLYMEILVPAKLVKTQIASFKIKIYRLDNSEWQLVKDISVKKMNPYYEEQMGDTYYQSILINDRMSPGSYLIQITNPIYHGKYVFFIGNKNKKTIGNTIKTVGLIYDIKTKFFGKNKWSVFEGKIAKKMLYITLVLIILFVIIIIFLQKKLK